MKNQDTKTEILASVNFLLLMGYDINLNWPGGLKSRWIPRSPGFQWLGWFVVPPNWEETSTYKSTSSDLNPQYNTCGINTANIYIYANLTLLRILKYYNLPRYIDISLWLFLVLIHIWSHDLNPHNDWLLARLTSSSSSHRCPRCREKSSPRCLSPGKPSVSAPAWRWFYVGF